MASAPPTLAPNAASVLRSTLTHGSSRLNIRRLVTAWVRVPRSSSGTPHASPTRPQTRRRARSEAAVRNWSAVALTRNSVCANAVDAVTPSVSRWRRYATPVATAAARASTSVAPASWSTRASTVTARQPGRCSARRTRGTRVRQVGGRPEAEGSGDRVDPEVPPGRRSVAHGVQERERGAGLVGDGRHDDGGEVEPDVGEDLGEVARRDAVVPHVHPHGRDPVLEVVEHGGPRPGGIRVVVQLADVPRDVRVAQRTATGERHRPRDPEGAVVTQVEGVDLEAALEVAAQGLLGGRAVEDGVVGAALVEHRGDEPLPVLAGALREPGRQGHGLLRDRRVRHHGSFPTLGAGGPTRPPAHPP